MANYSAIKAAVNAYIKANGKKEITGHILNSVLNATIDSLGRFFQFAGEAIPTDDPGTPDQNVCYLATEPGLYTHFGNIRIANEEVALLFWNGEWVKESIALGIQEVNASVDNQVGTPSVDVSYSGGQLVLTFHNLKGEQGETGDPAGFGTIGADITGGVGTPGVSVESSGDNTSKNLMFHFTNLKGETGVTSVVATIDDTSGTPSCQVSLVNGVLTLAFSGLKGIKGDTGVSADYPITLYNGLDSDATDQALAAAQGKVLDGKIGQLRQEIDEIVDEYILTPLAQSGTTQYYIKTDVAVGAVVDLTEVMSGSYANLKHYIEDCEPGDIFIINGAGTSAGQLWCFIDADNKKISSSAVPSGSNLEKIAPAGAAKIIINDRTGNGTQYKKTQGKLAELASVIDKNEADISDIQTDISEMQTNIVALNNKAGTNNYDNEKFTAADSIWTVSANKVVSSSSSYTNQRIITPITVNEGDTVNITQSVLGSANKAIFADSADNVISVVAFQQNVTDYIAPAGASRLYINRAKNTAFSCNIQSAYANKLDALVNGTIALAQSLPIYAPLPQSAADGQGGALDAENSTSTDIYNAIDAAIANYPSYAFGEILGKDATDTHNIKRYALCRSDLFAWRASDAFYAWKNNGVTFYLKTCSPYVGADIYNSDRSTVVGTVSAFSSVTGIMTDNSNRQYTRNAASDMMPDIIYTIRDTFSFDFDVYTKAGIVITRLTKTAWDSVTNTITYNSKYYVRSRVDDWGRNTKATVVLWANEHAAQSDPHEPAIVCYRLIRDLCQAGPSSNKFLSFLKNYCKIFIIPVANPYGFDNYAISKNTNGRLNGNGVNINRNYPTSGWTAGSEDANYGGAYGGSEIETQYIINSCIEFGVDVAIDIHCLSYTTAANEGVCAYGGSNMVVSNAGTKDIDFVVNSILADFNYKLQNYGEASTTGEGEGKNWLLANGIEGGLVEMNAGSYAASYDGAQHSGFIVGLDYTLLLRMLNIWIKRFSADLSLSNFYTC